MLPLTSHIGSDSTGRLNTQHYVTNQNVTSGMLVSRAKANSLFSIGTVRRYSNVYLDMSSETGSFKYVEMAGRELTEESSCWAPARRNRTSA